MAVKLILVSLVVLSISLAWAQQSGETGGSGRRISLRRFSDRRRAENTRNVGRVKTPADILEKRKKLFQRNPSRSRNFRVKQTTTTTTEAYLDVDLKVETISNNDEEVIELQLDNDKQEDEVETPFKGVSEVRTVSNPSGFRSLNEQIVRVSFKKTTTAKPEEIFPTRQKQRETPAEKVTTRNRLGSQRRDQQPASNSRRVTIAPPTERTFSEEGISDPLKALFKTANEPVEIKEAAQAAEKFKAAIREMKEDNRIEKPKSRSRGNSPRRLAGSSRNNVRSNLRGRNGQRNQAKRVVERKGSNPNFRSFPARQGGLTRTASQTTRPAPRQRFETRPTVLPAEIEFGTTELFQEFDFPASVNKADQFNLATEAPRSAFQLDQNFRVNTDNLISNQKQGQQVPIQQTIINPSPLQSIQPNVQDPQRFQTSTATRTQPPPSKAQQIPIPAQPQRLNSPQQVLSQNSFNLLNTNNFQAFDAQFGGSVPTNPGASRLTSSIFTQPLPALRTGLHVPVTPQNVFQATPLQPGQVFQPAAQTIAQPAATQFANVQPPSFSGHPADNINLRTGAFNLRTG